MPKTCLICSHPQREAIEQALMEGKSYSGIVAFCSDSPFSKFSLSRHKLRHLPPALAKAQEAAEIARGNDLLAQLRDLQARTLGILDQATDDHRLALSAIREARSNIELLGRLLGELRETSPVNILILPEWSRLRGTILQALSSHPEAKVALVRALKEVENAGP